MNINELTICPKSRRLLQSWKQFLLRILSDHCRTVELLPFGSFGEFNKRKIDDIFHRTTKGFDKILPKHRIIIVSSLREKLLQCFVQSSVAELLRDFSEFNYITEIGKTQMISFEIPTQHRPVSALFTDAQLFVMYQPNSSVKGIAYMCGIYFCGMQ